MSHTSIVLYPVSQTGDAGKGGGEGEGVGGGGDAAAGEGADDGLVACAEVAAGEPGGCGRCVVFVAGDDDGDVADFISGQITYLSLEKGEK